MGHDPRQFNHLTVLTGRQNIVKSLSFLILKSQQVSCFSDNNNGKQCKRIYCQQICREKQHCRQNIDCWRKKIFQMHSALDLYKPSYVTWYNVMFYGHSIFMKKWSLNVWDINSLYWPKKFECMWYVQYSNCYTTKSAFRH